MSDTNVHEQLPGGIRTDYVREYGLHRFTGNDGDFISVISALNWTEYLETLQNNLHKLGRVALSPELITSGLDLTSIAQSKTLKSDIKNRVRKVISLSKQAPDTSFVLGTAHFGKPSERPSNSMLVIKKGFVEGRINKRFAIPGGEESKNFRQDEPPRYPSHLGRTAFLVCSDLIAAALPSLTSKPVVMPEANLSLMSACWSTPMQVGKFTVPDPRPDEERFKSQLERCVVLTFANNPNLKDLIVSDRVPPNSKAVGPFNAYFYRHPGNN